MPRFSKFFLPSRLFYQQFVFREINTDNKYSNSTSLWINTKVSFLPSCLPFQTSVEAPSAANSTLLSTTPNIILPHRRGVRFSCHQNLDSLSAQSSRQCAGTHAILTWLHLIETIQVVGALSLRLTDHCLLSTCSMKATQQYAQ
jgi:hypothetical protein